MARAFAISLALLALLPAGASARDDVWHRSLDGTAARAGTSFVPGELIVRFRSGAGAGPRGAVLSRSGATASASLGEEGLRLVRLRRGASVRAAAAMLERSSRVLYAQPNHRYRLAAVPNDPRFGEQWGPSNAGQAVKGTVGAADADIDATDAWTLTTGKPSTVVAIADSGVAYEHPDLAPNQWRNGGEIGGGREANRRDDDRNGFVDDWRGWDFVDRDNDPADVNGHGTHVAGIAGARGNNGFGMAGVGWQLGLMALRVADADGLVTDSSIVEAFDYAAAEGARVVNASFVSPAYSDVLREAIRRHPKVLFVAAAGNGDEDGIGDDNDRLPQYPCSFNLVNLVCAAASDQSDRLASFSNFGRATVDLAAPGLNVLSAVPAYDALFSNGFEADIAGTWVTGGVNNTWGRITAVAHSGAFSLSDSPGTTYQNGTDSHVRTASPIDLRGRRGCRLEYSVRLEVESGADQLLVEVSRDGASWTMVRDPLDGTSQGAFVDVIDDISVFDGTAGLWVRFRLVTNQSGTADGAQIDDVAVRCFGNAYSGGEFTHSDGTSMAAPHVAGAAGLVLSRYRDLGAGAVARALARGVDRRAAFSGRVASGGRLNALGSIRQARRLLLRLRLAAGARQRAGRKGAVVVQARCNRYCTSAATGSVSISGSAKGLRLKRTLRALAAGKRKRLFLRLPRRARATVRRALARGRRVSAKVTVTATDRLGSTARVRRTVRIRR